MKFICLNYFLFENMQFNKIFMCERVLYIFELLFISAHNPVILQQQRQIPVVNKPGMGGPLPKSNSAQTPPIFANMTNVPLPHQIPIPLSLPQQMAFAHRSVAPPVTAAVGGQGGINGGKLTILNFHIENFRVAL
jgi:hypothetical protein